MNRFRHNWPTVVYLVLAAVLVACGAAQTVPKGWTYTYRYDESSHVLQEVTAKPCWADIADCERATAQGPFRYGSTYGASFVVPYQSNPNYQVGQWYWDPALYTGQNPPLGPATACASDGNNCTSATCGAAGTGIGPCATYAGIMGKLGASQTYTWPQNINVAITALSSQDLNYGTKEPVAATIMDFPVSSAASYSYYGSFFYGSGAVLLINTTPTVATLTTDGGTGVIAGLVAKNRSTNTPFSLTFPTVAQSLQFADGGTQSSDSGAYYVNQTGELLYNSTRNSYSIMGSTPGSWSQPFKFAYAIPGFLNPGVTVPNQPAEDDTWTNGDSFTLYNLQGINLTTLISYPHGLYTEQGGIVVDKVKVPTQFNSNGGDDQIWIGPGITITNSASSKGIVGIGGLENSYMWQGIVNTTLLGGFTGGGAVFSRLVSEAAGIPKGFNIWGGSLGAGVSAPRHCTFEGVFLDGDVNISAGNCRFSGYNYAGNVQIGGLLTGSSDGLLNVYKYNFSGSTTFGAVASWTLAKGRSYMPRGVGTRSRRSL